MQTVTVDEFELRPLRLLADATRGQATFVTDVRKAVMVTLPLQQGARIAWLSLQRDDRRIRTPWDCHHSPCAGRVGT